MNSLSTTSTNVTLAGVTGIRSMSGLATLSWAFMSGVLPARGRVAGVLAQPDVTAGLVLLAAGEMVADKLPFLPSRTAPLLLLWRIGVGASIGALVARAYGSEERANAVWGGIAAGVGAYGGRGMRALLVRLGIPDPVAGLVGDAAVLATSRSVLQRMRGAASG